MNDVRSQYVPDWIWEIDLDAVYVYSNRVVADILGYRTEEILGQSAFELMDPEDREKCQRLLLEAKSSHRPVRNVVTHFATKDGARKAVEVSCLPLLDEGGKAVGFRGISRDVTERESMREAAQEALEHYKAVVDNSPAGIFIVQNARLAFANPTVARLMGYTPDEVVGQEIWRFVHPDDIPWLAEYYRRRIAGEHAPQRYVARGITRTGEVRYFDFRANLIQHDGAPAVLLNAVDITEQRRAEEALRESQLKFRSLVESTFDWVWETDETGVYTYASPRIRDLLGLEPDEVLGRTPFDLMPPDEAERVAATFTPTAAAHEPFSLLENTLLHKDGHRVVVETNGTPIFDEDGTFRGYRGTDRDITLRKVYEERLERLNDCLLSLGVDPAENINHLVALCGELMEASAALYSRIDEGMLCAIGQWRTPEGYNPVDKPEGHICYDVIRRGGTQPLVVRHLQETPYAQTDPNVRDFGLQTYIGVPVRFAETRVGSLCVVFQRDLVPTEADETLMGVIASAIAIEEERRVAREELQDERNFAAAILDTIGALVVVLDSESAIVRFNRACEQVTGYSFDEVGGRKLWDLLIPPEQVASVKAVFADLRAGTFPSHYENHWLTKSGARRLMEWSNTVIRDEKGQPEYIIGTGIDVTERRQAEEALRNTEQRLAEVTNFLPDPTFAIDTEGRVIAWNRATEEISGIRAEDALGRGDYEYALPFYGERRPMLIDFVLSPEGIQAYYPDAERVGETLVAETATPAVKPDGIYVWSKAGPLYDPAGNVIGAIETVRDITGKKRTEDALLEAEEKYRSLVDESLVGVYLIQEGRFVYANPMHAEMLGYTQDELMDLPVMDVVAPESRELVRENLRRRFSGEVKSMRYGFKAVRKDGARIDVEVHGSRTTYQGKPAVIGSILDISERLRVEEQRRAFERRIENQKRQFYRDTILSVTDGKLDVCEAVDIRQYVSEAEMTIDVHDAREAASSRHEVRRFCSEHGLVGERLESFIIGIGEAITNAIKHAEGGRVYAGTTEDGVWVGIADKGSGIGSLILPRAMLLRGFSTKPSLGLGYSIMLEVADRILLKTGDKGTTVVLVKYLREPAVTISDSSLPDTWGSIPR